jgi:Flp pilus assembly protein TadD
MGTPGDEAVTRKRALIIAVSDYDKANHLEDLPFCKNDGDEMIEVLKSQGYEILDNHKLVGKVKYDVMWKAIHDFFDDSKITFNDALLLYYSGHGFYYPGRQKFTPDVCLGSSETNPDHPRRDGIPYNEIERLVNSQSCSARSVVTILDCCYSGAAILGSKGDDEGPKILTDVFDKQPPGGEGRCLLAASQQYEEAYTLTEENHSIFTHYLLKGLRGEKKSVDDNGNVTAFTLGRYVFNTISSLDPKKRPKQKPVIKAETSGDIVLAEYPDLAKAKQEEPSALELKEDVERCKELVDKKEFEKGLNYIERMIRKHHNSAELWYFKGICCSELKKYDEANICFQIGLDLQPDNKIMWNKKGEICAKLERYEEGLQTFEKALELDPNFDEAMTNKGLALHSLGRFRNAIYCFDRILTTSPNSNDVLRNKASTLDAIGDYSLAKKCRERAGQ